MRFPRIFMLVALLLNVSLGAQVIVATTYYVIPPTNGCNGVWAINDSVMGCDGSAFTDTTSQGDPCGLPQFNTWTFSGDTVFIPLCSLPCSLVFYNMMGPNFNCGFASTGTITSAPAAKQQAPAVSGYPTVLAKGNAFFISLSLPGPVDLILSDIQGKTHISQTIPDPGPLFSINSSNLSPGVYFVKLRFASQAPVTLRFIVTG